MKHSYAIHDALDFTIRLPDPPAGLGLVKYVIKQYANFEVPEAIKPGLEIGVADGSAHSWLPDERVCFSVDDDTLVWKSGFSTTGRYKQARWRVVVDGLFTDHTTVRIACNLAAYLVITGKAIDQVLALQLAVRGFPLVHAACVASERGGHLIAGSSGTGKTSVTLFLMEKGYRFLGDNFAIVNGGFVESFLSPLNVFSYNLAEPLRQRLSRRDLFHLRWRRWLYTLTRGYLKLFMKVNPVQVWPDLIAERAPLRTVLLLVSGQRFDAVPVGRDEIVDSLLYNMKLELGELNTWMARYTYVFPDFYKQGWWGEYRRLLLDNVPDGARCLRVEVPRRYDPSVARSLRALLEGAVDAG
jgi:hypothetical protein